MIVTCHVPPAPRIAVDHAGDGELVVFLHGVGGNRGNWRDQLLALAPRYHAAAWDARGYGDSDDLASPLSMSDFSADLLRVLDYFAADRAHLVGLSMGGLIAQEFVHRNPERVRSLVLADTGMGLREGDDAAWVEDFLRSRKAPLLAGRTPADIAPAIAATLVSENASPAARDRVIDSLSALRTPSYLEALETVTRFRNPLVHASVRVPTLVIVGEHDRLTPPAAARSLATRIPGARLEVLPGAGHLSNIEQPEAFNHLLIEFLDRDAGAAGPGRASRSGG